jgi:hypothetical protein
MGKYVEELEWLNADLHERLAESERITEQAVRQQIMTKEFFLMYFAERFRKYKKTKGVNSFSKYLQKHGSEYVVEEMWAKTPLDVDNFRHFLDIKLTNADIDMFKNYMIHVLEEYKELRAKKP